MSAQSLDWRAWPSDVDSPEVKAAGLSFDRTPVTQIRAPQAKLRVCAYHIDHDERPTCYVDVDTLEQALEICSRLSELCHFNVDYAVGYDDEGERVTASPW